MSEETPEYSVQYKIILLGDSSVGKTSIMFRYCKDLFTNQDPTVGVQYQQKFIERDGQTIKLAIWDTAGQERFRTLTKSFYRNIDGAILVYDITKPETLKNLETSWMRELEANATTSYQMMLVGNKTDLRGEVEGCVTTEQGEEVARRLATLFVECSAKSAEHVASAFEELVARIVQCAPSKGETSATVEIGEKNEGEGQQFPCC